MPFEKKRITKEIEAARRDPEKRLALAAYHRSRGNLRAEKREQYKARQCRRGINPDFDYVAYLCPGLSIASYVNGEVIKLVYGPYEYWADPVELQFYLEETPSDQLRASNMPLSDLYVSAAVLQVLADDEEVPGDYFLLPQSWQDDPRDRLKLFEDGSWLLVRWKGRLLFFSSDEEAFDPECLEKSAPAS